MKTYILSILDRYKKFNENLDVKALLCEKSWLVFNDSGEKELYIFQEDNTLLVSYAGRVTMGTWKYIPANRSLLISANGESYMFHPAYVDGILLALQQDGTRNYCFMIDEKKRKSICSKVAANAKPVF